MGFGLWGFESLRPHLIPPVDSAARLWEPRSPELKVREMISLLERDGWQLVATRGSHRQFKHPAKPGRVTVPGKPPDDLRHKTQASILRQAGLRQ